MTTDYRLPTTDYRLPTSRSAAVVSGAVDLAAGSIQIALKIATFGAVEAAAGVPVDALLGTNRRLVGAQLVELSPSELPICDAVADARRLLALTGIDPHRAVRRSLRRCDRGRDQGDADEGEREMSAKHDGLLSCGALARPVWLCRS